MVSVSDESADRACPQGHLQAIFFSVGSARAYWTQARPKRAALEEARVFVVAVCESVRMSQRS